MEYIAIIHKDTDSDYGVSFPDFPGGTTAGGDFDEARRLAQEALALHIAGTREDGEELPVPSTFEQITGDPEYRPSVMVLIPTPINTVWRNFVVR